MKFRKKPVVIETYQFHQDFFEMSDIPEEFKDVVKSRQRPTSDTTAINEFYITTLEGDHIVSLGDWIIKGVKGEFYPCKPDIFKQTYEEVCESCNKVKNIFNYLGKRYCNHCVNAEESGEKADN